jgi:hypothetical protein
VIHHRRGGDGLETRIVTGGEIRLDLPGLVIAVDEIYPA